MSTPDDLPWHGPTCPQCGVELDAEPIGTDDGIRIGYTCETHGIMSIADPFDTAD